MTSERLTLMCALQGYIQANDLRTFETDVFKQTPSEHLTLMYALHGCIQANDLQAFEIDVCTSRM